MKRIAFVAAVALMFVVALPLQAQSGCLNSPEAPTAVLAIVGSVGARFAMRYLRRR